MTGRAGFGLVVLVAIFAFPPVVLGQGSGPIPVNLAAIAPGEEPTDSAAGKVAMWTKADCVTYFDTISIAPRK